MEKIRRSYLGYVSHLAIVTVKMFIAIILGGTAATIATMPVIMLYHHFSQSKLISCADMLFIYSLIITLILQHMIIHQNFIGDKSNPFIIIGFKGVGYISQRTVTQKKGCPVKNIAYDIKNGLEALPVGTYYTTTHDLIINRIKRYSNESGRKIEIIKKIPIGKYPLFLEKVSLKNKKCKVCKKCELCPLMKNESVQMYSIKFKVL